MNQGKLYLEALGPDADADLELGYAHAQLGNEAEAEKHLTRCLDDVPKQVDCLRYLAAVLPSERAKELHQRLSRADDITATARTIIETALDEADHDAARMVLRALETKDPKHPLIVEFGSKVRTKPSQ